MPSLSAATGILAAVAQLLVAPAPLNGVSRFHRVEGPAPPPSEVQRDVSRAAELLARQLRDRQPSRMRDDGNAIPKPRVICGMTVIPVLPSTDPGIIKRLPTDDVAFHIRSIEPPICTD